MGKKRCQSYTRIGVFSIEEVLPFTVFDEDVKSFLKENDISVGDSKKDHLYWEFIEREYLGHRVKMNSHRYQNFAAHGLVCVSCGIEGKFFALESSGGSRFHFNLYGYDADGFEVMLTKDHIIPKSKGGKNHLSNYQPMCIRCNGRKGNGDAKKKKSKVQTDTGNQS